MTTEKPDKRMGVHVTFMAPVRVILQGKSTPIVAVTVYDAALDEADFQVLKCRQIFPINAGALTAGMTITIPHHNIAGMVPVELQ